MRKLFKLIGLVVMVSLLFSATAFAVEKPIGDLVAEQSLKKHAESHTIEDMLANDNKAKDFIISNKDELGKPGQFKDVKIIEDLTYGNPYKVINLTAVENKEAFLAFVRGDDFIALLKNDSYIWEAPLIHKRTGTIIGSVEVGQEAGIWKVTAIPGRLGIRETEISSNVNEITGLFAEKGVTQAEQILHIRVPYTDIIYARGAEGDYFMPIMWGIDSIGSLKNLNVYEMDEAMVKEFDAIFGEGLRLADKGITRGGPSQDSLLSTSVKDKPNINEVSQETSSSVYLITALLALAMLSMGFFRYRKVKSAS